MTDVTESHSDIIVKRKRYSKCDWCGIKVLKTDQREKQLDLWAKIIIKKVSFSGIWNDKKISYIESDMCPKCINDLLKLRGT